MPTKHTEAPPRCQLRSMGCQNFCETEREAKYELCRACLEHKDAHFAGAKGAVWHFGYTNYRGVFSQRRATPIRFEFESTEHHPEKQWIMHAIDHDRGQVRAFALADIVFGLHKAVEPTVEMMVQGSTVSNNNVSQAMAGNIYRAMEAMRVVRGMPRSMISLLTQQDQRLQELEQVVADLVADGAGQAQQEMIELREKLVIVGSKVEELRHSMAEIGATSPILDEVATLCKLN